MIDCRLFGLVWKYFFVIYVEWNVFIIFMLIVKCKYYFRFVLINGFVMIVIIWWLYFIYIDEICLWIMELKIVCGMEKNCFGFVVVSCNIIIGINFESCCRGWILMLVLFYESVVC